MSFENIFNKSSKAVIQEFKTTAQVMISNQSQFSCQSLSISANVGEDTLYPSAEDLTKWVQNLFQTELKPKPLNPKALEEMAKKGLKPKPQLNEIILVCIIPSTTHVHIGVSIPESRLDSFGPSEFLKSTLSNYNFTEISPTVESKQLGFAQIEHPESLKERDVILRCFFENLKQRKIYVDDEEEEEVINYLE